MRLAAASLVVGVLLATFGGPADAHEGFPGLGNVLDRVEPAVAGVTVEVVSTAGDQLVVANTTGVPLLVLAPPPTEEPFLEIGPAGVLANLNSPTWYASNDPASSASLPPGLDPTAAPRWARVSPEPSWGWFDPRLPSGVPPPSGSRPGVAVTLATWHIPMRYGASQLTVTGHLQYRPPTGSVTAQLLTPPPQASGMTLEVVSGGPAPAFFASSHGRTGVTILGRQGEPMLRFAPSGVEANERSPTWAAGLLAEGRPPAGPTDAAAAPKWQLLDPSPRISWIDPRAAYTAGTPPDGVQSRSTPTDLVRWVLPIEYGNTRVDLRGVTRWTPSSSTLATAGSARRSPSGAASGRTGRWVVAGAATLAVAAAVAARHRRRPRRERSH